MEEVEGEGVRCGGGRWEREESKEVEEESESERESDVQESRGNDIKIKNIFTSKTVFTKLSWNDNHSKTFFAKSSWNDNHSKTVFVKLS